MKYSVIDLFAGAGGLSLGFTQTNNYDIKVAFENDASMQETYRNNHPKVHVLGDVCQANYDAIRREYGNIDVVIGGPPCQGFSNANRQKNNAFSQNNMLVKQYVRAIVDLQPKAFLMENVSMLKSEVHRFFLEKGDIALIDEYDISVKNTKLTLLDRDFYFDGAIGIAQDKELIQKYLLNYDAYKELNVVYKACKNRNKLEKVLISHKNKITRIIESYINNVDSDFVNIHAINAFRVIEDYYNGLIVRDDIKQKIEHAIMIQRMLHKSLEIFDNNILVDRYVYDNDLVAEIRSFAVFDYISAVLGSEKNGYSINSEVLCASDYGVPQKRKRFVLIGIKSEISKTVKFPEIDRECITTNTVRDAIEDLESIMPVFGVQDDSGILISSKKCKSKLGKNLCDSKILKNHIVTKTTKTALERFRALAQGQNFHSLDEDLKTSTYTDVSRTQNTIYLRLKYDEPCGTVVNVRKSMWIHPTLDRAISIREAARLQTFPDSFIFFGTKDKQYQQVGNAVPPVMAMSLATHLSELLSSNTN